MRKQELVHLHTLLGEIANYWEEEGVRLELAEYHAQDTHPMAISRSKDEHETAVLALADDLTTSVTHETDGDSDEVPPPSAD